MTLYNLKDDNLIPIKKISFKNEKELQKLTENNLEEIFGLKFISTEFTIADFRLDTLAYNPESNAFIIIEYKNTKTFSVIDQGYSYLSTLLNHKADFVLMFNQQFDVNKRINDFDFSQTRVIFVSPYFTNYQLKSVEFIDIPFDLYEVVKYDNGLISYVKVNKTGTAASIKTLNQHSSNTSNVDDEIKVWSEDNIIKDKPEEIVEIYYELKERISLEFEDSEIFYTKLYFGFKFNKKIFVTGELVKSYLKIWINKNDSKIMDFNEISRDVSNIGHHGVGDYEVNVKPGSDLNYIITLIKQAYDEKINL